MMADYLKSENFVNKSYAAACIEKLLVRKCINGQGNVMTEKNCDTNLLSKLL